jgi:hypothetical protein
MMTVMIDLIEIILVRCFIIYSYFWVFFHFPSFYSIEPSGYFPFSSSIQFLYFYDELCM